MVGCNTGEIVQVVCVGEGNFQAKKPLKEHTAPVTDIQTCIFDLITVSGDVAGNVLVWAKNMKSVSKRISTKFGNFGNVLLHFNSLQPIPERFEHSA